MAEDVTVIHGDCLEVLPTLAAGSVDAVVTDPPYGIRYSPGNGGAGWTGGIKTFHGPDIVDGDDRPFNPAPLLALGVPTILWGANHYADKLPPRASWLVWDKRDGMGSNDFADCEMAWASTGSPARLFSHRWQGAFRDSERGKKRVHPTQKPVQLMIWCLKQLGLPPGSVVLDPYAGSGTTGIACIKAGLRCILIEKDPRYIPIIHRRLRDAATPLFAEAPLMPAARPRPPLDDAAIARRNALVLEHQGLVGSVARSFRGRGLDFEELVQSGQIGLIRAAEGFEPDRGLRFTTYATPWIKQTIRLALADTSRPIRLPRHAWDAVTRTRPVAARMAGHDGTPPSDAAVMDAIGIDGPTKREWLSAALAVDRATFAFSSEMIADRPAPNGPDAADMEEAEAAAATVATLLGALDDESRAVIARRYGLDGHEPTILTEVARTLGVSRQRVHYLEARALRLMRWKCGAGSDPLT